MGYENFSKRNPCPICGNDFCARLQGDYGNFNVLEKRVLPPYGTKPFKYVIHGLNGRDYIFAGYSKQEGYAMYLDKESNDRAWAEKRAAAGYRTPPKQPSDIVYNNAYVTSFKEQAAVRGGLGGGFASAPQEEITQYEPLPNSRLHSIYTFMMSRLYLDDWHRRKYEADGWTSQMLLSVKSSPKGDSDYRNGKPAGSNNPTCRELAKMVTDRFGKDILKGVPGAYVDRDGNWTFAFLPGVVFPMYDKDGFLYRLRIRMDYMNIVANKDLNWFGSYGEFTYERERYSVSMKGFKDRFGEGVDGSFFGDSFKGKYRTLASRGRNHGTPSANAYSLYQRDGDDPFLCYIVEGEPKSMYSNFKLGSPVISISGVNSFGCIFDDTEGESLVSVLKRHGTQEFVVAYDADGLINEMVEREKGKLESTLMEKGFMAAEADWSRDYKENPSLKGLDDLLASGKKPRIKFIKSRKGGTD